MDTRSNTLSSPILGMNLDDNPISFRRGEYGYCLNGSLSILGSRNIMGFSYGNFLKSSLTEGFVLIGDALMHTGKIVVFSRRLSDNMGEIGIFDKGKYNPLVQSKKLNFKNPIDAVCNKSIVYFTDDYNPPRHLDTENIPYKDGDLDIDRLQIFTNFKFPDIRVQEVLEGGTLRAGAYYFCIQYSDKTGLGLTRCSTPVGPISIYKDSVSSPFDLINGSAPEEITTKSVKLSLDNMDAGFDTANVYVIRSINGVKRAFKVANISTSQTSFLYTGFGADEIEVDLSLISQEPVNYIQAKCITRSSNILLLGNLKTNKVPNLQPYISQMAVQWQAYRAPAASSSESYKNPLFSSTKMGYRSNEVVALGFVILWKDGTKSHVYPLIGRQKNKTALGQTVQHVVDSRGRSIPLGQWDSYAYADQDIYESIAPERWVSGNTATVEGNELFQTGNAFGPSYYGEMGYYESTELYPNVPEVYGDNAGQPIRLFRMPDRSLVPLQDQEPSIPGENKTAVYILGVRITNLDGILSQLPADVLSRMQGWEIVRADRTFDKSIVASGLIHNCFYQEWAEANAEPDLRLYPNFPLNDLRPDRYTFNPAGQSGTILDIQRINPFYKKDTYTFYSPDTMFKKPLLPATELVIDAQVHGDADVYFNYVDPYPDIPTQNRTDPDKVVVQGISIGKYRSWKPSKAGNSRRRLSDIFYVGFSSQASGDGIGMKIQNTMRESAVYLKTELDIEDPDVKDTSRAMLNDQDVLAGETLPKFGCRLETLSRFRSITNKRTTSAYYASIRAFVPNQYGSLQSIKWVYTGHNHFNTNAGTIIFGGDTFLTEFSLKKQMVFFQNAQQYKDAPEQSEYDLLYTATLKWPAWYSNVGPSGPPITRLMCFGNNGGSEDNGGYLPLIFTGIPVFYVESDINTSLRHNGEAPWETFYNNLQDNSISLEEWSGIENVNKDNDFRYNSDYSDYNDLSYYETLPYSFSPGKDLDDFPTRVISSLPSQPDQLFDNWLVFKPLDYFDFDLVAGEIWSMHYLGGHRTMFRCTNYTYIDSVYTEITTNDSALLLGSGKLFQRKPIEIIETDNGYSGTHSQWSFSSTPFGHFFIDPANGSIFSDTGSSPKPISQGKCYYWFKKNLPLKFKELFPGYEHFDKPQFDFGLGYISAYDPITDFWFLTKRDYSLVDPNDAGRITFEGEQILYDGRPVLFSNTSIFKNESFTIAYDSIEQRWVSFYSFIPNYYLQGKNRFYTSQPGDAFSRIYEHGTGNYRSFYGKRYPFVIDLIHVTTPLGSRYSEAFSFLTKAINADKGEVENLTYNKVIISNNTQCSGVLNTLITDENNLSQQFSAWMSKPSSMTIELRRNEESWSMSGFYDRVIDPRTPFFSSEWKWIQNQYPIDEVVVNTNIDSQRDYRDESDFRDYWLKARMIMDLDIEEQILLFFGQMQQKYSPV